MNRFHLECWYEKKTPKPVPADDHQDNDDNDDATIEVWFALVNC